MIRQINRVLRRFNIRGILILLAFCPAFSDSSSVAFGMPEYVEEKADANEPVFNERQKKPNISQTDLRTITKDPHNPKSDPNTPREDPNIPKEKTIDIGNGITMEFVLIPAGEFDMGSPSTERDRDNDEGPIHRARISKPFYIGKYEVIQQQYYMVAKSKPSKYKQDDRPVENVSWEQAESFCKKLSKIKEASFRLPTEAEWEYACRAGSQNRFCFGDDLTYSKIGQYAWCSINSDSETHPVGKKKPNSFGLYDMHGNVWEWCSDYYAADYYHHSMLEDPIGALYGKSRVIRGGGWFRSPQYCRSANRSSLEPYYIRNHIGFRVVLEVE